MRLALHTVTPTLLVMVLTLGVPISARAGDHLACYKVKDTIAKAKFEGVSLTSDDGGPDHTGCTIATGAKFCCDAVDKAGVPPQPGGSGPGAPTARFCCYKVKCPKGPTGTLAFADQFGNRSLPVTIPKMVCAPVPTTTTTTLAPPCSAVGTSCGSCPGGGTCVTHCDSGALLCVQVTSFHGPGCGGDADPQCVPPGGGGTVFCAALPGEECGTSMTACGYPCP